MHRFMSFYRVFHFVTSLQQFFFWLIFFWHCEILRQPILRQVQDDAGDSRQQSSAYILVLIFLNPINAMYKYMDYMIK